MKLIDFIYEHTDLLESKEVVFFAGSFNPWHKGHTSCINLLPSDLPVVIIPDHNPLKDLVQSEEKLTNPTQIINQVKYLNRNIFLYDGFLKQNVHNPTYKWVQELKAAMPLSKISLLVGYDSFKQMPEWIEAHSLLNNLSKLYVASRLENDNYHEKDSTIHLFHNPKLGIQFLGHHKFEDLSSTKIRA